MGHPTCSCGGWGRIRNEMLSDFVQRVIQAAWMAIGFPHRLKVPSTSAPFFGRVLPPGWRFPCVLACLERGWLDEVKRWSSLLECPSWMGMVNVYRCQTSWMWIQLVLRFELLHWCDERNVKIPKAILSSKIWEMPCSSCWVGCDGAETLIGMRPLPLYVTMDAVRKMHIFIFL